MKRVFVSYSHRNKTFAERLARDLSDAGLDVWIDFREIQGGEQWRDEIFKGLDQAEIVTACLSPESVQSEWCRREIWTAHSNNKLVIPVVVNPCFDLLPNYEETKWLPDVQYIDFDAGYESAFPELLGSLPGIKRPDFGLRPDDIDPTTIPCPFKGLEAFQQTDANLFFGREDLINKMLHQIQEDNTSRFLAVVGASGSGKSSLVRAGLIPALRSGRLPDSQLWPLVIFMPGAQPIQSMAARLLPLLGEECKLEDLISQLEQGGPDALHHLTENLLGGTGQSQRLFLVVDQFEEVFTRASKDERDKFLAMLYAASTIKDGRTQILITMRADFFDRMSGYPDLARLLEQDNMLIATEMKPADLRRSIIGPAEVVGLEYEDGLADAILDEVRLQPGSLPLLQYALKQLYEQREGRRLTVAAYQRIGGVRRALAQHAETVYSKLPPEQQDLMRRLLMRLVEVSDKGEATRRKVEQSQLSLQGVSTDVVQALVEQLTSAENRLLIASRAISSNQEPVVWLEISHEALIREWDRLNGWIKDNQQSLQLGSEILKGAHDWLKTERDSAYLLTGTRLDRARQWLEHADATTLQRDFVEASALKHVRETVAEKHRQERELDLQRRAARRLRMLVGFMAVFLVAVGALSVFAFDRQRQAEAAKVVAELAQQRADNQARINYSRQTAARALTQLNDRLDIALLLALEGEHIYDTDESRDTILRGLEHTPFIVSFLHGHTAGVQDVAFSPDGKILASASSDRSIILWDVEKRQAIGQPLTGHENRVQTIAFSPDGKLLASGGADNKIILWDVAAHKQIGQSLTGHKGVVWSVTFSPDGKTLASASDDKQILLWDVATQHLLREPIIGHTDAAYSVKFSPDGKTLVSAGNDKIIYFWDVATGTLVGTPLVGHSAGIWSMEFSADGKQLVSGAEDKQVILWDVETRKEIRSFEGHTDRVYIVAFSPDGKTIAAGSADTKILFWDVETGQRTGRVFSTHSTEEVWSLAFSPDGKTLASGGGDLSLILWDLVGNPLVSQTLTDHTDKVTNVTYSADGSKMASTSWDNNVIIWDAKARRPLQTLSGHTNTVNSAAFSPDGKWLASGSDDKSVILWNLETGQPMFAPMTGHTDLVWSVAFSPDGKILASSSWDRTIRLWDPATGQPIGQPLAKHTDRVFNIAFSPDGKILASASSDGLVILWNVATQEPIATLNKHKGGVKGVAFSPDGKLLATAGNDKSVILWDVATLQPIGDPMIAHTDKVTNIAFSPDGKILASVSNDKVLVLWDVATHKVIGQPLTGHTNQILGVVFSPDGKTLATASWDKTIILWNVDFLRTSDEAKLHTYACRIANRNLTVEEWKRYIGDDEPVQKTCPDLP